MLPLSALFTVDSFPLNKCNNTLYTTQIKESKICFANITLREITKLLITQQPLKLEFRMKWNSTLCIALIKANRGSYGKVNRLKIPKIKMNETAIFCCHMGPRCVLKPLFCEKTKKMIIYCVDALKWRRVFSEICLFKYNSLIEITAYLCNHTGKTIAGETAEWRERERIGDRGERVRDCVLQRKGS